MRALQILGAVLVAAGLFLIIRPPSYPHQESVFKLGNLEATVQDRRTVPEWVGGVLLGAGCVLVIVGMKRLR